MAVDWGTVVLQVTAIVGGLAALIAILNGLYELRERRQKHREQQLAKVGKETSHSDSPSSTPRGEAAANGEPSSEPASAASVRRPGNLPAQPTGLIGREKELVEIQALLLGPDVRLLTLTGPAGVGKTRLALQVASNLLDRYPDGVFFVPLAPVADSDLVIPTISHVLDVREQGSKPLLELLQDYLHEKHLLLLLDNFEQVTGAAQVVAELLAAAPDLSIIVTSREVLHLSGEHAYVVPPLALPDFEVLPPRAELVSALSGYEAVRLFVARAQAADSHFALTEENAAAVAEIVNRLDGLPLAIELAAARVRLLPPRAMLQRLMQATQSSPLQLLTGGPRDLPARQQTLRNTIAWSYDLLDDAEQALFQRLGVFAGGWTLEAAEAVGASASSNTGRDAGGNVLEALESLIAKSLVWQTSGSR
ncbi:MAG: ATP-binding protein, partial [Nitrososphaerales archaeon]